jgi:hypothetical protein
VAEEILRVVTKHIERGGGVYFWSPTMRHHEGQSLEDGFEALSFAFGKRVIAGSSWQRDRDDFGIVGYIKAPDLTYGPNGWHPHLPVLIFTESPLSVAEREGLRDRLYHRWKRGVAEKGFGEPLKLNCPLDRVRMQDAGSRSSYVAHGPTKLDQEDGSGVEGKWIGMEMQRHDIKAARHRPGCDRRHMTPFQILSEIRHWPEDEEMRELWEEYEQATRDRKSVTWSRSLSAVREEAKQDGDSLCEEEVVELVSEIDPVLYRHILRSGLLARLLEVAEGLHGEKVSEFLGRMRAQTWEKQSLVVSEGV